MRCEIVRCDACGREILPGATIIRVMRGLCGVVPSPVGEENRAAEYHAECVHVVYPMRLRDTTIPLPMCVQGEVMRFVENSWPLKSDRAWRTK